MSLLLTEPKYYPSKEEKVNVLTHGIAAVLSGLATLVILFHVISRASTVDIFSLTIFGTSLTLVYTLSAFFHAAKNIQARTMLNVLDRASIYALVAGTITPFALISVEGMKGYAFATIIWIIAIVGIFIKIFTRQVHIIWSTAVYALFGWLSILGIIVMLPPVHSLLIQLLITGNIIYTVGAVFFTLDRIPFNHATFHLLAMMGSFCHFTAVFKFVLPLI